MAVVSRVLLAVAYGFAGIPFASLAVQSVRYAVRDEEGWLPGWSDWLFAASALAVTALFAASILVILERALNWDVVLRAILVALPLVAIASLASPPLIAGMLVLLLGAWALRRRDARYEANVSR
jgi:hypothetical protein